MKRVHGAVAMGWGLVLAAVLPGPAALAQAVDCQVQITPALLDYGSHTRSSLLEQVGQAEAVLAGRSLMLSVQCPVRAQVAVMFVAPASTLEQFGFGPGTLQLQLRSVQVDGASALLAADGAIAEALPARPLRPNERVVPVLQGVHAAGTSFAFELEVVPRLPADATRVAQLTRLETAGKFQVTAVAVP